MADEENREEEYNEEEEELEEDIEEDIDEEDDEAPRRRRVQRERTTRTSRHPSQYRGRRRKVCSFCIDKVDSISYKDINTLQRFVDNHGKIVPRRKTGTCAKHQRQLTTAVKRARHLALLTFSATRAPRSQR